MSGSIGDPLTTLQLEPSVIATGFMNNGLNASVLPGQVASLTSSNNYINFCLTIPGASFRAPFNSSQVSCNPAPMGVLPSIDDMLGCKFIVPQNMGNIRTSSAFVIQVAITGINSSFRTQPINNYLAAPQHLDNNGRVQGHLVVVIEAIDSIDSTVPTDPKKFAFFTAMSGPANGPLMAVVNNGLPAGVYRAAALMQTANHAPVLSPIEQHGASTDHVYFTVSEYDFNSPCIG
ncbi:hypothetical protein NP233_g11653 [Leucocoprinus birnbaumii]|uniref:Uncharacterized protein n=1 Tax=Leucocoprinus birnbaumii TaxID=56174 RepID=A0AAD5YL47_9AGAR|nr:hypothetical protein NP233_g11653 [Leucocoprinus birnbaumii]